MAASFAGADLAILSYVCKQYSAVDLKELLDDIVYKTEPMVAVQKSGRRGQALNMGQVDNDMSMELGVKFEELLQRSWDLRSGDYLTHAEAMALVDSVILDAA